MKLKKSETHGQPVSANSACLLLVLIATDLVPLMDKHPVGAAMLIFLLLAVGVCVAAWGRFSSWPKKGSGKEE